MRKIEMYKEVPEAFHARLMDTLSSLEETGEKSAVKRSYGGRKKFSPRKLAVLAAAAVLAFGTMTVGAVSLFRWHTRAEERFGVEGSLEEKLTAQEVAVEEAAASTEGEITLQAIQSVRTARNYYILLQVTVPEGVSVDEDTIFDTIEIDSSKEFNGSVVNIVADSIENNTFLCEVTLLTQEGVDYTGEEIGLTLKNLIQTHQAEQVGEPLVEGAWKLSMTLTAQEPGVREFYVENLMKWGQHSVLLHRIQVDSFGVNLYVDKNQALHASQHYAPILSAVEYEDGTLVEEGLTFRSVGMAEDESMLIFGVSFEQVGTAVDVDRLAEILIGKGEECITLEGSLGSTTAGKTAGDTVSEMLPWEEDWKSLRALYANKGYAVVTDDRQLYLWDMDCGRIEESLDLEQTGYDPETGEILVGVNGHIAYICPGADSDSMYLYLFGENEEGESKLIERPAKELTEENKEIYRGYQVDIGELMESVK